MCQGPGEISEAIMPRSRPSKRGGKLGTRSNIIQRNIVWWDEMALMGTVSGLGGGCDLIHMMING